MLSYNSCIPGSKGLTLNNKQMGSFQGKSVTQKQSGAEDVWVLQGTHFCHRIIKKEVKLRGCTHCAALLLRVM